MNVLIADKFEAAGAEGLKALGCAVTVNPELGGDTLRDAVKKLAPKVLIVRSTKVTADVIEAASGLALIIRAGSGYDTIDVDAATRRGVRVCNCPGMNSIAVAELTLGLMIALDRRIVDETADLRRGVWSKKEYSKARGLKGATLGIAGLGRIGYEVARRAAAFDMNLIYHDVVANQRAEEELGIKRVSLDELLAQSDFISLHLPGGGETKHLIGAAEIAKMKPGAFLLNCSRGGIVDEKALAEAVREGKIGGAGIDVWEIEPAATDREFKDPLIQAPRIYGTHHVGASTDQAQRAVADETVRVVQTYKDAGEFLHCVNPTEAVATT
jgi:D-3-phosphoglycerate dehydrogenase